MPIDKSAVKYTLAEDVDISGMIWRKASSVFALPVAKSNGERFDLFLTPHKEYAKRGSHAPVIRLPIEQITIDGDTIKIAEIVQPAATLP